MNQNSISTAGYFDIPDIKNALSIAAKYYTPEDFAHAKRVAEYIITHPFIPEQYRICCTCLALMHDLLEDTSYTNEPEFELDSWSSGGLSPMEFHEALLLLTRPKDMEYMSYIKRFHLLNGPTKAVNECAWWVKLADMKDHFAQRETLSDSLKQRYLQGLSCLL